MTDIYDFPDIPVSKQVFHVPGGAVEGGYTAGAVRIMSPEPGGRSVLELQVSLQTREWDDPLSSWLMSMGNGEVFRVRLAPTPQVLSARSAQPDWRSDQKWSTLVPIATEMVARYTSVALEGSTQVTVDMVGHGDRLRRGHVIGHGDNCYMVDHVQYDHATRQATVRVKPPLRKTVQVNDRVLFRPYFLGTVSNLDQMRAPYEAANNGTIQLQTILFSEAIA